MGCVPSSHISPTSTPMGSLKKVPSKKRFGVESKFSISPSVAEVDMIVDIPDPFKSSYKIIECVYHKTYRKLYSAYSRDKREVIIEYTDLAIYLATSGRTEIDYFTRLDILRELNHPCLPKVVDFFDGKEVNRIVFEMAAGKDLAYLLKAKGPPKLSMVKPFMLALISVVQYLHSQGLIHQNLKPSSLILAAYSSFHAQSQLKLVGLNLLSKTQSGTAAITNCASLSTQGSMPTPLVTPSRDSTSSPTLLYPAKDVNPYCAPEIPSKQYSYAVDLYSIGAILYALISGHPPASPYSSSSSSSSSASTSATPALLSFGKEWQKQDVLAIGLEPIVKGLLSSDPTQRPSLHDLKLYFMKL